jgi:Domain of unknown function (DUF4062)
MRTGVTVFDVLIASPSDVQEERQAVRDAIQEWNIAHGRSQNCLIEPVMWETHSTPELGQRPQQVVNEQIVEECDALIGTFWTRLGSPTGEAPSGTVEEIDKLASAGKPVKLYFSKRETTPERIDPEQLKALREFKAACMTKGLLDEYVSPAELRAKLNLGLQRLVERLRRDDLSRAERATTQVDGSELRQMASRWKFYERTDRRDNAKQQMEHFAEWCAGHEAVVSRAQAQWATLVEIAASLVRWVFTNGHNSKRFFQIGSAVLEQAMALYETDKPVPVASDLALAVLRSVASGGGRDGRKGITAIQQETKADSSHLEEAISQLEAAALLSRQRYVGGKEDLGLTGAGVVAANLSPP